jgi:hypothetical protein
MFSCDDDTPKEEECISTKTEYFTSVNSPNSGVVNETVDIELKFPVYNGCGEFNEFIETINGNTINIEVEAIYTGCICTTDAPIRTIIYQFLTDTPGTYELYFKSSPTDVITISLNIE